MAWCQGGKHIGTILSSAAIYKICSNMYSEQLVETEIYMDYSDPLSDEELSFDVLSRDSTCLEEPKTLENVKEREVNI